MICKKYSAKFKIQKVEEYLEKIKYLKIIYLFQHLIINI